MTDPAPKPALPAIQYADLPARHGIIYQRTAGGLTMVIPIPVWRRILMLAGGFPFLIFFLLNAWMALAALLAVLAAALIRQKLKAPVMIELTADQLILRNIQPSPAIDRIYRRGDVYDVHYVSHSGQIVIHAHNQEMQELQPVQNPELLKWIAITLNDAIQQKPDITEAPRGWSRADPCAG